MLQDTEATMKTIRFDRVLRSVFRRKLLRNKVLLVSLAAVLTLPLVSAFLAPVPAMALGEAGWEKQGTAVISRGGAGAWDSTAAGEPSVIKDGSTYKMWYSGQDAGGIFRIGYATSSNGASWNKHSGNPVLAPGATGSWDAAGIASPTVIKDGGTYKMWYMGENAAGKPQIGYATSTDGITWQKHGSNPVVQLGTGFEADGVGSPSVILDGATFKMWYTAKQGEGILGMLTIGYATSSDGVSWSKNTAPVLQKGSSSSWEGKGVGVASVIKDGALYKMWYTGYVDSAGVTTSKIGFASSSDGISWTKSGSPAVNTGDVSSWEGRGVGGMSVMNDAGSYKMWYSGLDSNLAASTGLATIPSFTALTTAVQAQSPTTFRFGVTHRITSILSGGVATEPAGGIVSYQATASYDGVGINILSVAGVAPFGSPSVTIENAGGSTTYSANQGSSSPQAPMDIAYITPRLVGGTANTYTLSLQFNAISSGSSLPVNEASPATLNFRRGDTKDDGNVDIVDALYIAQYLATLRPLSQLNPLNAASPRQDGASGDGITIQDAMFIAQMLAGLRDASYNLI